MLHTPDISLVSDNVETELGRYNMVYVIEQVSLSPVRIKTALKRNGFDPEKLETIMETAVQAWMEQGGDDGLAKGFKKGLRKVKPRARLQLFCIWRGLRSENYNHLRLCVFEVRQIKNSISGWNA